MKRYCVAIAAVAVFAGSAFADTTWVEVGTAYGTNAIPFWGNSYDASRFQALYMQEDINQAGEIVAFGLRTSADAPAAFYNFRVKLCHTDADTLKSEFSSNYVGNEPEVMLDKDTLVVGTGVNLGWYYFPCSFVYNNSDNLLMEIAWRGDAGRMVRIYRNSNGPWRRAYSMQNDSARSGSVDDVNAYNARIGFVPVGVGEGGSPQLRPVLSASPTHGAGAFHVEAEGVNIGSGQVDVHDAAGRFVERLSANRDGTGLHATWDAKGVPAGVYFIELTVGDRSTSCRVVKTE